MSDTKSFRLTVHFEEDHMWAEVDDLPGCFASGRDMEELREALAEAIGFYLTEGPQVTSVATLHVERVSAETHVPARVELAPC